MPFLSLNRCVPLRGIGNKCDREHCKEGLFCDTQALVTSEINICQERLPLNSTCSFGYEPPENCQYPFRCSKATLTCQPFEEGSEGDLCFSSLDCSDELRCEDGQCIPKTPDFSLCTRNYECNGSCIMGPNDGICVPLPTLGERCNESCFSTHKGERVVCNIPRGREGHCVKASSLITTIGSECDQTLDSCDASRGLSCRFSTRLGKSVCQQRVSTRDIHARNLCDPNNEFSECLPKDGAPQECLPFSDDSMGYYRCFAPEVEVKAGDICERAGAICPQGTKRFGVYSVFPDTCYCLPALSLGESCGDPFDGLCDIYLTCENGTCIQGEKNFQPVLTHVGYGGKCRESIPCAPGTVCREECNGFFCLMPVIVVGYMEECFPLPTIDRVCDQGLVCRGDFNGLGIVRCRDLAMVGETCFTDDDCEEDLRCASENYLDKRCYDAVNSLGIGEACGKEEDNPCGEADGELLKCLPQRKRAAPKCQKFRGLYGRCDPEENVGCLEGLKCESNVCFPKRLN